MTPPRVPPPTANVEAQPRLWSGRFETAPDPQVTAFTTSMTDRRMWEADIDGSIAHAEMLGRQGIIASDATESIVRGLHLLKDRYRESIRKGETPFDPQAEDIHSEIELRLREIVGESAGRLHTARSRNDQVATGFRLQMWRDLETLAADLKLLVERLTDLAEQKAEIMMPGYTHLQHAQPVRLGHHLLAYAWMFRRDSERFLRMKESILVLPLGSAALAGTGFPVDREWVCQRLGFHSVHPNSLDAVSDRDFVVESLSGLCLVATHLSRLAEELILWSCPEFGFVELSERVTTGSSIMPQKKNPDVAELIRGRSGRAVAALVGLLQTLKALPLSYNRDLQEDKEWYFSAQDAVTSSVTLMTLMLAEVQFKEKRMAEALAGDFSNATDLADDLVRKGVPFREAHEVAARTVRWCIENKRSLESLDLAQLKQVDPRFDENSLLVLPHAAVANARTSQGGTGRNSVAAQIESLRRWIETKPLTSAAE